MTIFDQEWALKNQLAVLLHWGSSKFFHVCDIFWSRLGTKKSPCYIEAAQNFFMYVTIFDRDWAKKNHLAILRLLRIFPCMWQSLIEIGHKKTHLAILRLHKILSGTWQFLIEIGHKKITLLYWGSSKFFHVIDNFWSRVGTKKSACCIATLRQLKIFSCMWHFLIEIGH